jgi:hypothetical protein
LAENVPLSAERWTHWPSVRFSCLRYKQSLLPAFPQGNGYAGLRLVGRYTRLSENAALGAQFPRGFCCSGLFFPRVGPLWRGLDTLGAPPPAPAAVRLDLSGTLNSLKLRVLRFEEFAQLSARMLTSAEILPSKGCLFLRRPSHGPFNPAHSKPRSMSAMGFKCLALHLRKLPIPIQMNIGDLPIFRNCSAK